MGVLVLKILQFFFFKCEVQFSVVKINMTNYFMEQKGKSRNVGEKRGMK